MIFIPVFLAFNLLLPLAIIHDKFDADSYFFFLVIFLEMSLSVSFVAVVSFMGIRAINGRPTTKEKIPYIAFFAVFVAAVILIAFGGAYYLHDTAAEKQKTSDNLPSYMTPLENPVGKSPPMLTIYTAVSGFGLLVLDGIAMVSYRIVKRYAIKGETKN